MTLPPLPRCPEQDGLAERVAGPWVEDKLKVLWCYLHGFATACSIKARAWYYIDGLAGCGVNRVGATARRLAGSPILALETSPQFDRCLMVESNGAYRRALEHRTAEYKPRAIVEPGDCNRDLVPAMQRHIDPRYPCLCVLDPEGSELEWSTVRDVAEFKKVGRKAEQLILLPTDTGFIRELPIDHNPEPGAVDRISRMYGNQKWLDIYARRKRGELTPDQARGEYVKLYASDLKEELRYKFVLDRQIFRKGRRGNPMYFLIFATDHIVGRNIMNHCMDTGYPDHPQQTLFKVGRGRRLKD